MGTVCRWWNILSVGAEGAGLPLHEHGAAWLALGEGQKLWATYPPGLRAEDDLPGRPAIESSRDWFAATHVGGLRCTQEAGTVVLLPAGWRHATVNTRESWGVGRQRRQWDPATQLLEAESAMDRANPQASRPSVLLRAGLALREIARTRSGQEVGSM